MLTWRAYTLANYHSLCMGGWPAAHRLDGDLQRFARHLGVDIEAQSHLADACCFRLTIDRVLQGCSNGLILHLGSFNSHKLTVHCSAVWQEHQDG